LGADAVFMGWAILTAMGCLNCRLCPTGKCPQGIMTQDPALVKKLKLDDASKGVANFIAAATEEVKMAAAATGKNDVHKLNKGDVRSLSWEITQLTGIPLV